ncbi:MAG: hypothetical protein HY078_09685 [Elusimicrobia bacterium]|nr:hypothetical protein [Elusimicrobiota bacterium]
MHLITAALSLLLPFGAAAQMEVEDSEDARAMALVRRVHDTRFPSDGRDVERLMRHFGPTVSTTTRAAILDGVLPKHVFEKRDSDKRLFAHLKKFSERASKDPDAQVRYAAGRLSRALDAWRGNDSPEAVHREKDYVAQTKVRGVLGDMLMVCVVFLGILALVAVNLP